MKKRKLLMACCNYWNSPFQVGSHHIAKGFMKLGWEVAFLSDPISPLHILSGISDELKDRFKIYKNGGIRDYNNQLWAYVPGAILTPHNKPILRSEWVYRSWPSLTLPKISLKIREEGFDKVDLMYIDSLNQSVLLNKVDFKKSVFRVADKNSGFSKNPDSTFQIECGMARKVDAVIYTAHTLKKYTESMGNRRTFYMPNGVNFEHFAKNCTKIPEDIKNIPRPIAIYVGAIADWFDFDCIMTAANALPKVSFVLIGPSVLAKSKLKQIPNIYLLGPKSYEELPQYLHNANVGMIPFNVHGFPDLVNSINPLKLYEYMACGLPVVSTEWKELKLLQPPALLCKTHEEFIVALEKTIENKNKKELCDHYIKYAEQQNWTSRVEQLIKYIDEI